MATYYVKTNAASFPDGSTRSRTLFIEADRFEKGNSGDYFFYKTTPGTTTKKVKTPASKTLVAAINSRDVLAVLEEDAYQADYFLDHSQRNLIEAGQEIADRIGPLMNTPVPETPAEITEEYPIEHWQDKNGTEWWGFHTDKGFVSCESKEFAEVCRGYQIDEPTDWGYLDLTTSTRLED